MVGDDRRVEEELGTVHTLGEEVGSEECDPLEDGETSARLEHEHRDDLLDEESNDDSGPVEHDETRHLKIEEIRSPWDMRAVL